MSKPRRFRCVTCGELWKFSSIRKCEKCGKRACYLCWWDGKRCGACGYKPRVRRSKETILKQLGEKESFFSVLNLMFSRMDGDATLVKELGWFLHISYEHRPEKVEKILDRIRRSFKTHCRLAQAQREHIRKLEAKLWGPGGKFYKKKRKARDKAKKERAHG